MVAVTQSAPVGFEPGRVVRRTFEVIRRNLPVFFGLSCLLAGLPQLALSWSYQWAPDSGAGLVGFAVLDWLLATAFSYALQAALIHGTVLDLNGRSAAVGPGLALGLRHLIRLVWLAVFISLAVTVGLILFIVPGLIMLAAWAVAVPVIVVEGKTLDQCLGRSGELTKGVRWPVFGLVLCFLVVSVGLSYGFSALAGLVPATAGGQEVLLRSAFGAAASAISSMVGAAGVAALYFELREAKDGLGPATVASVFD